MRAFNVPDVYMLSAIDVKPIAACPYLLYLYRGYTRTWICAPTRCPAAWHHHHRVDMHTGALLGRFEPNLRDEYNFELIGDGTWIISIPDSNPVRIRDSGFGVSE